MKHIRQIAHPFNLSFKCIFTYFPGEEIESLGIPGEFIHVLSEKLYGDLKEMEMDGPYLSVWGDGDLKQVFACDVEHDNQPPNPKNFPRFSRYILRLIQITGRAPFFSVASKHAPPESALEFEISPSLTLKPFYPDLGELNNRERLNTVRNKINFNREISIKTGLHLANALLFVPNECAEQRVIEALNYYLDAEITDSRLEFVLCTVVSCMVDAYVEKEEDYRRYMKLINDKSSVDAVESRDFFVYMQNKADKAVNELNKALDDNASLTNKNLSLTDEKSALIDGIAKALSCPNCSSGVRTILSSLIDKYGDN